jgi:chemotaxis regulatin CheY-phosphate phosphatase CheZ
MKPFDYPFQANGMQYHLRYSFQARRAFERKHKKSVPGMLKRLSDADTQTADELVDLFMLMLATDHPDLTSDKIDEIIEVIGGEDAAVTLLTNALASQVPGAEGDPRPQ